MRNSAARLARSRDAAVRTALGAGAGEPRLERRDRESAAGRHRRRRGVLLAYAGLELFRRSAPIDLPRLTEIHLNLAVLLFSMALTFAASILSGMLPALRLLATDPQAALQQNCTAHWEAGRATACAAWLIGLQVCGCTALLLITGLFSKSLLPPAQSG